MSDPAPPADPADYYGPDDDEAPDTDAPRLIDPRTQPARFHHLKAAGQSGAHCLHAFQGEGADSLAKRLGSGVHALLFGKPTAVWRQPAKKNPSKIAPRSGDAWIKFQADNAGAVLLTVAEEAKAGRIVSAIRGHGIANRLLFGPGMLYEQSIIWSECGRQRRSTPDARGPEHNVELKTTKSAAPWAFARDAERYAYHAQLADQRAAIAYERGGRAPREHYIVAVESAPPYVVQVYELPETTLELGDKLRMLWLERLQMYEATGLWGGYSPRIEPLEILDNRSVAEPEVAEPDWARADGEASTP